MMNRNLVIELLRELADTDFQSRAWRGLIPNEMHSFEECFEMMLGDSGLSDALSAGAVFSSDIDDQFRELERVLGQIVPWRPVDEILADPLLPRARTLAAELLAQLI